MCAFWTRVHIGPDDIVYFSYCFSIRMKGIPHPPCFAFVFRQNPLCFPLKLRDIHGVVIVVCDEGGGRREVIQNRPTPANFREWFPNSFPALICFLLGDRSVSVNPIPQRFDYCLLTAHLGRNTSHPRPAEPIEDHISWFGVMQNVTHDGFVRHLGVVGVGIVDRVVLALAYVSGERFAAVWLARVVGLAVLLDEVGNERIRAGGVVRRVGERQDVFI